MEPPASDRSEVEWISSVIAASGCDLLLDLHNVHANGLNFGFAPIDYLDRLDPRFLAAPREEGERQGLTVEECAALERIDRVGLELSARSFAHKRALKASGRRARSWWNLLFRY